MVERGLHDGKVLLFKWVEAVCTSVHTVMCSGCAMISATGHSSDDYSNQCL